MRDTTRHSLISVAVASALMAGGWIPGTTRVKSWETWGKAVPRR